MISRQRKRRPDFCGGRADHAPLVLPRGRSTVRVPPALEMLVRVLDHHHGGVDHRADGDRNATERHDVGVDTLVVHDDEGRQDAERQRHDRHQRRAQVEQEHRAHERHDEKFLEQLLRQVVDRALDQRGSIVGRHDLHALREARLEARKLRLHRHDRLERILAGSHHDDATGHFAFAVQLGDAATRLGADLYPGDVTQAHRHTGIGGRQRNLAEVVERAEVAGGPHHVLGLAEFEHGTARLLVRPLQRLDHPAVGDPVGTKLVGVEHDLVLAHHAAYARHFGHVRNRLQLELEEPVLQRAQLGKVPWPVRSTSAYS